MCKVAVSDDEEEAEAKAREADKRTGAGTANAAAAPQDCDSDEDYDDYEEHKQAAVVQKARADKLEKKQRDSVGLIRHLSVPYG
jgi:hypothetical protein